jgi:hypothetical protein
MPSKSSNSAYVRRRNEAIRSAPTRSAGKQRGFQKPRWISWVSSFPMRATPKIYGQAEPAEYVYKVLKRLRPHTTSSSTTAAARSARSICPNDIFGHRVRREATASAAEAIADTVVLAMKRSTLDLARTNRRRCRA